MDKDAQAVIDSYKGADGVLDWYRVLQVPRTATPEQIRDAFAILSATYGPSPEGRSKEKATRHVLLRQAFTELDDPARRRKYDAFLRHPESHARLLVAIETARQEHQAAHSSKRSGALRGLIGRADSRLKRVVLVAFPFFASVAFYVLAQDLDRYSWEPSLSFILFTMASALCLLIAFTKLGDWLSGQQ